MFGVGYAVAGALRLRRNPPSMIPKLDTAMDFQQLRLAIDARNNVAGSVQFGVRMTNRDTHSLRYSVVAMNATCDKAVAVVPHFHNTGAILSPTSSRTFWWSELALQQGASLPLNFHVRLEFYCWVHDGDRVPKRGWFMVREYRADLTAGQRPASNGPKMPRWWTLDESDVEVDNLPDALKARALVAVRGG